MTKTRTQMEGEIREAIRRPVAVGDVSGGGSRYDGMTGEELDRLPANGKIQREAFGTRGNQTPAQAANAQRMRVAAEARFNRVLAAAMNEGRRSRGGRF